MDISLRDLRPKLTAVIAQVKSGWVVNITERGKVVAQIIPVEAQPNIDPGPLETHEYLEKIEKDAKSKKSGTGKGLLSWVQKAKIAQQARDDLLRGVNRKS